MKKTQATKSRKAPYKVLATAVLSLALLTGLGATNTEAAVDYPRDPITGKYDFNKIEEQAKTFTGRIVYENPSTYGNELNSIKLTLLGDGTSPVNSVLPVSIEHKQTINNTLPNAKETTHKVSSTLELYKSDRYTWVINGKEQADFTPEVGKTYTIAVKHTERVKKGNPKDVTSNTVTVKYTEELDIPLVAIQTQLDGTLHATFKAELENVFGAKDVVIPNKVSGLAITGVLVNDVVAKGINNLTVSEGIKSFVSIKTSAGMYSAFQISGDLKLPSTLNYIHLKGNLHANKFSTATGVLTVPKGTTGLIKDVNVDEVRYVEYLPTLEAKYKASSTKPRLLNNKKDQSSAHEIVVSFETMSDEDLYYMETNSTFGAKGVSRGLEPNEVVVSLDDMFNMNTSSSNTFQIDPISNYGNERSSQGLEPNEVVVSFDDMFYYTFGHYPSEAGPQIETETR